jgi:hypothetical protein
MLSLAIILTSVAIITLSALSYSSFKYSRIHVKPSLVRVFKADHFQITLSVTGQEKHFMSIGFASCRAPAGVESVTKLVDDHRIEISLTPRFAGRFKGLEIETRMKDAMNLFSKRAQLVPRDFSIDSLPRSILAPVRMFKVNSFAGGDAPTRKMGRSLDLYSLDEYRPFEDAKDMLWKRVARMPDEKLIVRLRESNIPRVVKIALLEAAERSDLEKVSFMDLVCESLGFICVSMIGIGCLIEILTASSTDSDDVHSSDVTDTDSLADALMKIWDSRSGSASKSVLVEAALDADLLVTGFKELEDEDIARLASRKICLTISEEQASPLRIPRASMTYSGVEDLGQLVMKVVESGH